MQRYLDSGVPVAMHADHGAAPLSMSGASSPSFGADRGEAQSCMCDRLCFANRPKLVIDKGIDA